MSIIRKYIRAGLPTLALGLLLSGCGAQPAGAPAHTAIAQPTSALAPTAIVQPTSASAPTAVAQPTSAPAPAAELFYVEQGALYARAADGAPRRVADVDGDVLDVAISGDALLVLRPAGIDRFDLAGGASRAVVPLDPPAGVGSRLLATRDQKIFYAAWSDDPNAVFGKTQIGYYDPQSDSHRRLTIFDGRAAPLGLTPAGDGLYLLPIGGDPSFGQVRVIDIASGGVRAELAVEGETMPAVSPDGRLLVVPARQYSASDPDAEPASRLYLYDLTAERPQARVITPPKAPSAAVAPLWAPDGSGFYFGLGSGNIYELKESYGLWRYDIATGAAAQIADVDTRSSLFDQINPAGALLVRHTTTAQSQLVNLASGAATPLALEPNAIVAGWR